MARHDKNTRVYMVEKYHEFKSSLKVIEVWKEKWYIQNRFVYTKNSHLCHNL